MSPRRRDAPLKPTLTAAIHAIGAALADLPVPGMLIGGIAVIARGVPRLTRDVDATVAGGTLERTEINRTSNDCWVCTADTSTSRASGASSPSSPRPWKSPSA